MTNIQIEKNAYLFPLISAMTLCLLLFYIDEGYMDFRWMRSAANWGIFSIYVSAFIIGFSMITAFVTQGSRGWKKKLLIYILGIPLSCIMTAIFMFFGCLFMAFYTSVI